METPVHQMTIDTIKEHMAHLHTLESFARTLVEAMCVSAMSSVNGASSDGTIEVPIRATVAPSPIVAGGCTKANPCMAFVLEVAGSKIHFNLGMGCELH